MKNNKSILQKRWLLTLMDLMLLMLTFFIMLYSVSVPKHLSSNLKNFAATSILKRGVHLNYLEQILSQQLANFEGYYVINLKDCLIVNLPVSIFAHLVQRKLTPQASKQLQELGETLSNVSNDVILQVDFGNLSVQENILIGAVIANKLKEGGYTSNLKIIFKPNTHRNTIQLIIFEKSRDVK